MSRRRIAALMALAAVALGATPALAQDGARGSPPERIDLTIPPPEPMSSTEEACERQREAALVSGEIVVCGGQSTVPNQRFSNSREEAQRRYAAQTQGRGPVQLPELGIFKGPATVSGICVPGIFNCPKPPALIVDVRALPQAPPGSDADRIARGLAPIGEDVATPADAPNAQQRAEFGLPPPPAAASPQRAPVASPEESAAPAAPR